MEITMDFSDYVSDILGLHEGLMSESELRNARDAFDAWNKEAPVRKAWKAGSKVLESRAVAALFGGKALTGSAKQKEWGEKIRAEKLRGETTGYGIDHRVSEMTEAQAAMACDPSGLGKSAHFWIENRSRSASEIGAFFAQQKRLLREAMALREAGKADQFAAAAAEYNNLTTEWGFTQ